MKVNSLFTRNINLHTPCDTAFKREEIKGYFLKTFALFEKVFDVLANDQAFYERPEKRRHQLIFYFGHTACFYINKLVLGGYITQRINPHFESIFAIGVDEMAWDDLQNKNFVWPSVDEVRAYRNLVKMRVVEFIDTVEFILPIGWDSPMWAIMMGCEHERIHIETSSVLHRQLDIEFIKKDPFWNECLEFGDAPPNELLKVSGGVVTLGKSKNDPYYGWDNEYGEYSLVIEDFEASKYLVSNGEFIEFVNDGGYEKQEYWSDEGWKWLQKEGVSHPVFWLIKDKKFFYRSLTSIHPLPMNYPVDVNFLEAEAFCNYKSKKLNCRIILPSEGMWHRLHSVCGVLDEPKWDESALANINLEYFGSSTPVDCFRHGDFFDVIGNVWQWTTTPIDGFEGFEVHPLYDDFSTPTFDGKHAIIKGGSWISTGNETLKESRYAFRRHFYQHSGFRYVCVGETYQEKFEYIEKDSVVIDDIRKQYVDNNEFYPAIVRKSLSYMDYKIKKALDLGCGVGRIGFELAKTCQRVFAVDFSARFIRVGDLLKKEGKVQFLGGSIDTKELQLDGVDTTRLEFWQGDACNLKATFCDFDFVIMHDVVSYLYDEEKFIESFSIRVLKDKVAIFSFKMNQQFIVPKDFTLIDTFMLETFMFYVCKKQ